MGRYLKVIFLFTGLFYFSKSESVLGNIDSITIEIDLDSDNNRESTEKSESVNKIAASDFGETTVYIDNEENAHDQKNTIKANTDDSKILSGRDGDAENDFENSTLNEGAEKKKYLATFAEEFFKRGEHIDAMIDDSVIKTQTLKTFWENEKLPEHNFVNEPIRTSETLDETKWTQKDSSEHENKASVSGEYEPLDTMVHNLLHRYKTTPAINQDDLKFNENDIQSSKSSNIHINRIKAITPLTRITEYDQIPTKTTTTIPRPFRDSTESDRDSTYSSKESTVSTIYENINTIIDSRSEPVEKGLSAATRTNINDETTISEHVETTMEWMPLNADKGVQDKPDNTILTEKDEVKETRTVVPIAWIPEYETRRVVNASSDLSTLVATEVTNNNYSSRLNTSTDFEARTETDQNESTSVIEKKITSSKKINKSVNKSVCKYAKNFGDFDINKLTGVLQTVYYTMPDKIPCFKMIVMKLSNEEKQQYHEIYGDFGGSVNWTKCDLEVKAETKIKRKHFLQSSGLSDGVFENKIIMDEDADENNVEVDEKPTLIEDSPDQWSVVNNLVLLRDCKTGRVLFFKRNPRSRVSHRELKEALFAAGEGFNGRLSCRHRGHNADF